MVQGGTFVEKYFEYQTKYEGLYGKNTVVLIQKGTFYEIYGIYNETENIGKAKEIAELLNISLTFSNKNIQKCDRSNPNMTGIPAHTLKKYMKVLMDNYYHVIVIDQCDDTDTTQRKVSQIYSPGTYDEDSTTSVNICGVFYDQDFRVSVCTIDVSIGKCAVYEIKNGDMQSRKEELYRLVHASTSSEVVLFVCTDDTMYKDVQKFLGIEHLSIHNVTKGITQEDYATGVLQKVYGTSLVALDDTLGLRDSPKSKVCLSLLLSYIYDHNENIIDIIELPSFGSQNNMVIHNNAMHQLNIINPSVRGKGSLFDALCKCSTQMGRRLFKTNMLSPFTDSKYLRGCYDEIDCMMKSNKLIYYTDNLKHICDIERMTKKMKIGLTASEFKSFVDSCSHAYDILFEYGNAKEYLESLRKFIDDTTRDIDIHGERFFKDGVYIELDNLRASVESHNKWLNTCCNKLSKYINTKSKKTGLTEAPVKFDNKHYIITTTPTRGNIIKGSSLENKEVELYGQLSFKSDKSKCIISSSSIDSRIHELTKKYSRVQQLENEKMIEYLQDIYTNYSEVLLKVSCCIAQIDIICNKSTLAIDYDYCKPEIVESDVSFISASGLRHGLIELLDGDTEYVPNEVNINPTQNETGILLYGVNGSGKSCYSKSIGVALIMAQMGMYAPASVFRYSPYKMLFTRINCDDNIFRGHSSFFVEMSELRSIINYADCNSIVLGDEICKGTESVSALGIVGATINHLLDNRVSFVFATHLHKLPELTILKERKDLSLKHVHVEFDSKNTFIKYTRKILDGQCDSVYGLEIADYILQNKTFFKKAYAIRNEVIAKPKLLSNKKSKYNSGIFVDSCEICKSSVSLDVHHIEHQHDTEQKMGRKTNKTKNDRSNLVTLCKVCHNKHHSGKITIKGWIQTSGGRTLDYSENFENDSDNSHSLSVP